MDPRTRADGASVDARASLASWLREGRDRRKLTIEDVAKITKIQPRILEKLEAGELEGLPAEVFVRGFVRSFAKCVGLDESEAIHRYASAQQAPVQPAVVVAKALVDTIGSVRKIAPARPSAPAIEAPAPVEAPVEADPSAVEAAAASVPTPSSSTSAKKKRSRRRSDRRARKAKAALEATQAAPAVAGVPTASEPVPFAVISSIETGPIAKIDGESPAATSIEAKTDDAVEIAVDVVTEDGAVGEASLAEGSARFATPALGVPEVSASAEPPADRDEPSDSAGAWKPTMPPLATTSVPWRRPNLPAAPASAYVVPTLVIDDADPESADREREVRAQGEPQRLSFLPPILLDREDRSARQGGLTLAVIILLIAATLTLSYLMRRPSPSGDGVTMVDDVSSLVG